MKSMQLKKLLLPAIAIFVITGCSSQSARLSDASVRTVAVSPSVKMPQHMFYMDLSTRTAGSVAALGGLVGVIVAGEMAKSPPSAGLQIEQVMARNNIRVDQIVRDSLAAELRRSSTLSVATTEHADAELRLTVAHGLSVGTAAFERRLGPVVSVTAELIKADGTVVWTGSRGVMSDAKGTIAIGGNVRNIGRDHAHLFEEYQANPQLLRSAFQFAAQNVARDLVQSIRR